MNINFLNYKTKKNVSKILVVVAFTGLVLSANAQECDTQKWKVIKTYYGDVVGGSYYRIGELDGAVLNADTISHLFPEIFVVNISNDTFASNVKYEQIMDFYLYADTGLLSYDHNVSSRIPIGQVFFPNDTVSIGFLVFPLPLVINYLKEEEGIELEQISYWKIITGVSWTSTDGTYSDSVFYAGADTVTFRVVRGNVGINNYELPITNYVIYPNPTTGQLRVVSGDISDGGDRDIKIFNVVGQVVFTSAMSPLSPETTIDISHLANGLYFLKIDNKVVKIIKN